VDLIHLLEVKGMKDATDIKREWFSEEVAKSVDKLNRLYAEICLMVLKLRKKLDSLELREYVEGKGEASFGFCSERGMYTHRRPSYDKDKQLVPSSIEMLYKDRKWGKASLKEAVIFINAGLSEPSFSLGFYNKDISEECCNALEDDAVKKGFHPERETGKNGKLNIFISHYLIGGNSDNGESKDMTFDELENSLRQIRDFVRGHYGTKQTPRIKGKSKRKR
jgi:hypothetical protein